MKFTNKTTTKRVLGLILMLGGIFSLSGRVYAENITVTCNTNPGDCVMTPSAGAALFADTENDNINMLPGQTSHRTIDLINNSSDTCEIVLGDVTNVRLIGDTPETFPYELWTALSEGGLAFYGGLSSGQATSTKSLGDLFDGGDLPITSVPGGDSKTVDWHVTFNPLAGNAYQSAETRFDFDMHFMCDEIMETTEFTIAKFTSSWPTNQNPGDTVTYTLTIQAPEERIYDVVLTDLPPETFEYVNGNWNIASNMRLLAVGEPTYASPGQWDLGMMEAGEVLTLTYDAKISDTTEDGIYPDLAYATGRTAEEELVYADSVDSGFEINGGVVDENFVGTQVKVNQEPPAEEADIEVETEEIEEEVEVEGEVLGSSDQRLPATGASLFIGLTWMLSILTGAMLIFVNKFKKAKAFSKAPIIVVVVVVAAIFLGVVVSGRAHAQTSTFVLRVSEPETPTNKEFNVEFVVLDPAGDSGENITVTCDLKKPGQTFSTLDTANLIKGGDSGLCKISESLLTTDGTYEVKITAQNSGASKADTVSVVYDGNGPGKPKWIEKDKKSSCEYDVKFKTSDDGGETSYVEVYRSDDKEFTVSPSSRVRTVSIGSNEEHEFTHNLYGGDCGSSYYAVRAFDDAGNYSDVRVEEVEDIVIKEVFVGSDEGGETEEGGEGAESGAIFLEGGAGLTEGELEGEVGLEEGGEAGEVAGETTETEEGESGEEASGETAENEEGVLGTADKKFPWFLLVPVILVAGFVLLRSKRKKDGISFS
ncbi:DUF11 domain-containing protein [candidate division WWE3 bacterium]|nr:DUF11 domain-containing protein [candidate division WWE3 bacterium]